MSKLELIVNDRRYGGWKSVRVTRSIEAISGSFEVEASDRWADQDIPWPIAEEDAVRVEIDGTVVIDGWVDSRRHSVSGTDLSLSYSGRDRASDLVDCSARLKRWTFMGVTVYELAKKICEPFGIPVHLQPGLVLPHPQKKQVVNPGDSCFDVIQTAAKVAEVLVISDGKGGILITRSAPLRAATPLIQGENVLTADVEYNAADRFRRYIIVSQTAGEQYMTSDEAIDHPVSVCSQATDTGVRRSERALMIQCETGISTADARRRGDWEARNRAARAERVTVSVREWRQSNGVLWPINAIVPIRIPRIGIDGEMLISQVELSLDTGGERTTLHLVRPDAFTPEPYAVVNPPTLYKEIAGGVKLPPGVVPPLPPKKTTP
jgi:prophage tail gpP-like protein